MATGGIVADFNHLAGVWPRRFRDTLFNVAEQVFHRCTFADHLTAAHLHG